VLVLPTFQPGSIMHQFDTEGEDLDSCGPQRPCPWAATGAPSPLGTQPRGADRDRTDDLFVANEALSQTELQPHLIHVDSKIRNFSVEGNLGGLAQPESDFRARSGIELIIHPLLRKMQNTLTTQWEHCIGRTNR
jgi:hypothetical protein